MSDSFAAVHKTLLRLYKDSFAAIQKTLLQLYIRLFCGFTYDSFAALHTTLLQLYIRLFCGCIASHDTHLNMSRTTFMSAIHKALPRLYFTQAVSIHMHCYVFIYAHGYLPQVYALINVVRDIFKCVS